MSITTGLGREEVGYNYLVNSSFLIWQRATSQTTSGYGSDDRWSNDNLGSTKTASRQTSTDTERAFFNSPYYSRTVVSSVAEAGNFALKAQRIEDVTKLAGKTITVSFWAKADASKNVVITLDQRFGTGGSPSANLFSADFKKVALTSTWQYKTVTLVLPSIVGKTLGTDGIHTTATTFAFWFDAGSNFNARADSLGQQSGTFDIAEVKLEVGSVATPFSLAGGDYAGELQKCMRYYEKISADTGFGRFGTGFVASPTSAWATVLFAKKRRPPDITSFGNFIVASTNIQPGSITVDAVSTTSANLILTTTGQTAGQAFQLSADSDPDAYIAINAEL
jgi:hypothetical protein